MTRRAARILLRVLRVVLSAIATLLTCYLGFITVIGLNAGLTWDEINWNLDGITSLEEIWDAADIVRVPIRVKGRACTEFIYPKDFGLNKVKCPPRR